MMMKIRNNILYPTERLDRLPDSALTISIRNPNLRAMKIPFFLRSKITTGQRIGSFHIYGTNLANTGGIVA